MIHRTPSNTHQGSSIKRQERTPPPRGRRRRVPRRDRDGTRRVADPALGKPGPTRCSHRVLAARYLRICCVRLQRGVQGSGGSLHTGAWSVHSCLASACCRLPSLTAAWSGSMHVQGRVGPLHTPLRGLTKVERHLPGRGWGTDVEPERRNGKGHS